MNLVGDAERKKTIAVWSLLFVVALLVSFGRGQAQTSFPISPPRQPYVT
jgi:hypothetical protein